MGCWWTGPEWKRPPSRAIPLALALLAAAPQPGQAAAPAVRAGAPESVHVVGPPLIDLRAKIADPNWLMAWLLKPSHLRRRPLMRDFNLTVEDARVVASYLYTGVPPRAAGGHWRGGNARVGKKLFVSRGCRGCHTIAPTEAPVSPRAPNLAGIGIKVRGEWLFNWLKSPRSYDPNTSMPRLVLTDEDIRHLVAFLLSHREGAVVVAAAPRFVRRSAPDAARRVLARFDCAKCHLIRDSQTIEPSHHWALAPPACATCHEPSDSALETSAFGPPAEDDTSAADALRDGRRLVAYYSCRGCHRIEGKGGVIGELLERKTLAPPTLDDEGARVQTSWLIDFLQHPTTLRPWLQMRMPDFGLSATEATALAKYFAALAHVPPVDETQEHAPEPTAARGARRFAHFKCVQCHPANLDARLPPGVDPEDLSINLALTKTRLRPSWIRDFLARPKALVGAETRMPAVFYSSDGIPNVDHPEQDIAAITAYLLQMNEMPTAGLDAQSPEPTPPTDWTTYKY